MTHINTYTKKDGTIVLAHEDARKAAPWWVGVLDKAKNPPAKGAGATHPRRGDKGERVQIHRPHTPSPEVAWREPAAVATFTPNSPVPAELNGVPFAPWEAPDSLEGWASVEGQREMDEPPIEVHGKLEPAAGVIVEEDDGRIWIIHPTNAFGGYQGTFPKGHQDDGMPLQAVAIKEAWEESGLKVAITGYAGDVQRTTTVCRYYTAKRVGGTPKDMGWETQAVSLVPRSKLYTVLNRAVDHDMAEAMGAGPRPAQKAQPVSPSKFADQGPAPQAPWWGTEDL